LAQPAAKVINATTRPVHKLFDVFFTVLLIGSIDAR
jgi:hypothetical protein